ncbi:MAG: NAD(P)/FAD-dependent oxidoreductase [Thermomicrobiales bacterium]
MTTLPPPGYARHSYWLETCGDDLAPRPSLDGSVDVDVAILGAGYSGLWTAYYLLKREPPLRVAIVEAEIAGFGASGRNGAWCTSGFPTGPDVLAAKYGKAAAQRVVRAMAATVAEVGRVADAEGIDIQWTKGGQLIVARGPEQLAAIAHEHRTMTDLGFGGRVRLLDKRETDARVRIAGVVGGYADSETATIHPGRLVRGLARTVERMGATIFERTPVTAYTGGPHPALHTARGDVRARTIVLCGEAYLSRLKPLRRQVMPVYSLITLTEPLSAADWAEIGWEGRECVASCRYQVDYLSKTADGRILFGGRGAPYHFGSSIKDGYDRHSATHSMLMDNVRAWFPRLKDVRFSHTWGGPLGWPRDFMPTMAYDPVRNVATARGYTGNGVATANLAGRILTDLITGRPSDLADLPCVNHRSPNWEPEPFRFLGVRYVQRAYAAIDAKAEKTGIAPDGTSLAERLTKH